LAIKKLPGKKGFIKEMENSPKRESATHSPFTWTKRESGIKASAESEKVPQRLNKNTSLKPSKAKMTNEVREEKKKHF